MKQSNWHKTSNIDKAYIFNGWKYKYIYTAFAIVFWIVMLSLNRSFAFSDNVNLYYGNVKGTHILLGIPIIIQFIVNIVKTRSLVNSKNQNKKYIDKKYNWRINLVIFLFASQAIIMGILSTLSVISYFTNLDIIMIDDSRDYPQYIDYGLYYYLFGILVPTFISITIVLSVISTTIMITVKKSEDTYFISKQEEMNQNEINKNAFDIEILEDSSATKGTSDIHRKLSEELKKISHEEANSKDIF